MMKIFNSNFGVVSGKKGIVCVKRISKVASINKRSPGEKTGLGYTAVHAGIGDGTG